jgi:CheY-like chemotaxis protein
MGGREAVTRLHAVRPDVRVLYMSGYTGTAAEQLGPLGPDDAFIQKPFSLETLLRKVREVLDAPEPARRAH